jgi:hypothetical protein
MALVRGSVDLFWRYVRALGLVSRDSLAAWFLFRAFGVGAHFWTSFSGPSICLWLSVGRDSLCLHTPPIMHDVVTVVKDCDIFFPCRSGGLACVSGCVETMLFGTRTCPRRLP